MLLTRKSTCTALALAGFTLLGAAFGHAQEPTGPRDDALDRLLQKAEEKAPAADTKAKPEVEKPKEEAKKPTLELAPKDQALDSLLEKLGQTKDNPDAPDEKRGGPPMPGGEGKDQAPAGAEKPGLTGKAKDLDEHLEELTGRKRKKKDQDEQGSGPLGQVIKEMRDVEQRLGKTDTGEETRKKQAQIVKNLEQLIEQIRNSSSQGKGQKIRIVQTDGEKQGQQSGQPGANAGGAPNQKPLKPDGKRAVVGGKDVWGHLPNELRQEMDNVAREVSLPSKEELIRLYFLSVSKKSLTREE